MTRRVLLSALLLVAALAAGVRAEPQLVVADCQVTALAGGRWIVRLRSTAAQAFDVVGDGEVRLHGARATGLVVPPAGEFGAILVTEDERGVVVRLVPPETGWLVTAEQGESASEVRLRVERR